MVDFQPFPDVDTRRYRTVHVRYHKGDGPLEGTSLRLFTTGHEDVILKAILAALGEGVRIVWVAP